MNIYRVFRLGPINNLPTGAVLEAIVVAAGEGLARGQAVVEEMGGAAASDWLRPDLTRCQEIGVANDEYTDDLIDGDAVPHSILVSRKAA